ncbi:MAG: sulfatase-like hydrolase/transferase [Candidatus Latescibacteria bacterium]|nr:sulfatase-like hydrolase/transferase [Candidatus Latescibacterota bacterium]
MDRRDFIKKTHLAGAGVALSTGQTFASASKERDNKSLPDGIKNIMVLFVDQQRQDCIGCYGNDIVQTPNLDRLARNGIRFNNAYTPAPVCTPARTCLETGLLAHKHRLIFNTARLSYQGGLQDPESGVHFFSESLDEKGFNCAHIGKWHIGTEKNKPVTRGYDDLPYYPDYGYPAKHPHYVEYLKKQGVNGFNLLSEIRDPTGFRSYSGLQEGPQSASIPAYLASQTVDTIKQYAQSGGPFFVSCNFWGPHAPYNITRKHYEMYKNEKIKPWPNFNCNLSDKPGVVRRYGEYWKTGWFTEQNLPELIGLYYGYISLIDEEIGRILKTLEDTGELDNTLIIYSADHGSSVGSYQFWDKGFGMYDVITRIPMIVSHPSITPGESDAFVTLLDLAPTFLEAAGCEIPDNIDGSSLMPILSGKQKAIREDYIVTEHFGHQMPFWQRMVRTQNYKYIYNPTDEDEYYDLDADPYELTNVIDRVDKRKLTEAREILMKWMKDTKDPVLFWATPML